MKIRQYMVLFIAMVLLSGCAQEQEVKDTTKKEYTIFGMFNKMIFNENWPVFQEASKQTGVTLKAKISQNAVDEQEAFNLMVASGDLPDILRNALPEKLNALGVDGGLIPLQDLVDEHAPNIKKFWEDRPDLKRVVTTYDGNIYHIPYYPPVKVGAVHILRKDWLDKLGLPVPETMEEFYNTLVAFKTQDPNGNGLADEIPWFQRSSDLNNTIKLLLNLFQISYMWSITEANGVEFELTRPEFKDAIRQLSKWYKEGLIDPEIFTRDFATARDYMFGNNLGGYIFDWASTAYYIDTLKDTVPGFNLIVILPPVINGERIVPFARNVYTGGWGISSMAKDPVGVIKYMDYWFSKEGRRLWNFGIEGDHYTMVNGEPIFTDKVLKAASPLNELYKAGAQWEMGMFQDYDYEKQISHPIIKEGYKLYIDEDVVQPSIGFASLQHSPEIIKEYSMIQVNLESYAAEMIQKWIMGASDIDKDWDSFVKRLDDLGLQRATEINEEGFKRYMKS